MKIVPVFLVALSLLLVACGGSSPVERVDFTNGAVVEGELGGAPFRIAVPPAEAWNGTLYVYAPGYRRAASFPGDTEDRSVVSNPGGLPLEQALLAQGFAVAGTAYVENGWVVEPGIDNIRDLRIHFANIIAQPERTILNGFSMGSAVALASLERNAHLFDGVIASCNLGGGSTRNFDLGLDFLLAYDAAFGIPESWGTVRELRSDLVFATEVLPVVIAQLQDPANLPRFEFIRLVLGLPEANYFTGDNPFFFTNFFFATEARARLEARAGGVVVQNRNRVYSLPPEVAQAFSFVGVDATGLLQQMNMTRIDADLEARRYLSRFADFTGEINEDQRVLLMHTQIDSFVLPGNSRAYGELLQATGKGRFGIQTYTSGIGHCAFTGEQILVSILAMDFWLENGALVQGPFFTEERGFLPGFVPPPLP